METNTKESSRPTTSKAMVATSGSMAENLKDFGKTIKCMERALSSGVMAGSTKASTSMRRRKDMESLPGLMEDATRDSGKMENRMVREFTATRKGWKEQAFGQTARKLNGLIDKFMDSYRQIIFFGETYLQI